MLVISKCPKKRSEPFCMITYCESCKSSNIDQVAAKSKSHLILSDNQKWIAKVPAVSSQGNKRTCLQDS